MLLAEGVGDVVVVDRAGVIHAHRDDLGPVKAELARRTNRYGTSGSIADALRGADVLVGVSGGSIAPDAVATMAPGAIVLALANPTPEIHPDDARAAGAAVVATGRSDFPNQINNVLAFPGIFRGALDAGATRITEGMKLAAAQAIADLVGDDLDADHVVPSPFDPRLAPAVAAAVEDAAVASGVVRA
jgi:malate dehydrogenase (oxaloacetate-decarboxylating)